MILEFWATWCVPCVVELPALNALEESLNRSKFTFIAIDDEDAVIVKRFLVKHKIGGWLVLDRSGKTFRRYGVEVRPTTVVIAPNGRVVAVTTPDKLDRSGLLKLAADRPGKVTKNPDSTATKELKSEIDAGLSAETASDPKNAVFSIALEKSDPESDSHAVFHDQNNFDITNASPAYLMQMALQIPRRRIDASAVDAALHYDLHVHTKLLDREAFDRVLGAAFEADGIGMAITENLTHVKALERTSPREDSCPGATRKSGFAIYDKSTSTLKLVNANSLQIASALEDVLGIPIVDNTAETCPKTSTLNLKAGADDPESVSQWLASMGFKLRDDERSIRTYVLKPNPPIGATPLPQ